MNKEYAEKVEILLRLLPIVMDEKVFAVHGGSAINLFCPGPTTVLSRYRPDLYPPRGKGGEPGAHQ
mgnify:CR=1 FL=1